MNETMLPTFFALVMALAVLVYAILDGYDLGVGILLPLDNAPQSNKMIASIGPFWDANETWLVLAVGVLLMAFPKAYGLLLGELYIPVFLMLLGLILRGVAFDFRVKAASQWQDVWNKAFKFGSILAALSQGFMLGLFVTGFSGSPFGYLFAVLSALCVTASYAYIGGAWLVMKCEGDLQTRASKWARYSGWLSAIGISAVCILNPIINEYVFTRWFGGFEAILLLPIPTVCLSLFCIIDRYLSSVPHPKDFACWLPFTGVSLIFFLSFLGLAYSFFPYIILGELTIAESASSVKSLQFMFWGVVFVVPLIVLYTLFSYRVFWGKSEPLQYY